MGIIDLFRPKWKNPNLKIRKSAVESLMNQKALANIAKNDPDIYVRIAAVRRLTDQQALSDIAKNESNNPVRKSAVEGLTDQKALADIARNDSVSLVRKSAVERMTDQQALADVAKNDSDKSVRESAVERLTDQQILEDIAKKDSNWSVRKSAVERMTDQQALADVAKNDSDKSVRESAVERLTDQQILEDIAKKDSNWSVRSSAVERLTDQQVLEEFAKNDSDSIIRATAARRLTNQESLEDVLKNDSDTYVRKAAVKSLTDQQALAYVAKNDSDSEVREIALERITSQQVLVEITGERKLTFIDIWRLPTGDPEFYPMNFDEIQMYVTMPVDVPLEEVHQWYIDELGRDHLQIHEIKHRGYNFWVQQGSQSSPPREGINDFFHCVELSSSLARCERFELTVPQSLWGKDGPLVDKAYTYRMNALIDGEKDILLEKKSDDTQIKKKDKSTIPVSSENITGLEDRSLLVEMLVSDNEPKFLEGLKQAITMADTGDIKGLEAMREAMRIRSGKLGVSFYEPGFVMSLGFDRYTEARPKIIELARKHALLNDPEHSGNLISAAIFLSGGNMREILHEIYAVGGPKQGYAFQLIFNELRCSARLKRGM